MSTLRLLTANNKNMMDCFLRVHILSHLRLLPSCEPSFSPLHPPRILEKGMESMGPAEKGGRGRDLQPSHLPSDLLPPDTKAQTDNVTLKNDMKVGNR